MYKNKTSLLIVLFFLVVTVNAQEYFSFYQLKDYVPQSQTVFPAHMPKNTFTVSLPGLNLGLDLHNGFTVSDALRRENSSSNLNYDLDNLLFSVEDDNYTNINGSVNLLHLGYRRKNSSFSLFINSKVEANFLLSKELYNFLINGNTVGETIDLSSNQVNISAYHEIGFGYARSFMNDRLKLGVNLKLLTGLFHASTEDTRTLTLATQSDTFNWVVTTQNASLNTAGIPLFDDDNDDDELSSYLTNFNTNNSGVAFDFGGSYQINDKFLIEFSVNDIGSINWEEQVVNYNIEDGVGTYEGLDLKGLDDTEQAFEDELNNVFTTNETNKKFKKKIGAKTYFSASYQLSERNRFSFTSFNNHVFGTYKPSYAVSYNRTYHKSSFGILTSFGGNRRGGAAIGGNFVVNLGPVQMYAATDNFFIKIEDEYGANFRFGINLKFGHKRWEKNKIEEIIGEEVMID